ncbi:MAG: DUF4440 domain-containing protein [Granulicella sp.]
MPLRSLLLIAAFSLGTLTPPSLPAQEPPLHTATQQELDVVKVMLKQEAAWNRGDIDGFTQGYKNAPDTLFISRQINRGFEGMAATYKQTYPTRAAMGNLGFSELEVRPLGANFAVCVGKYHLERSKKDGGNADGIFSQVFEKTDQGWKIILDHTT